MIINTILSNYHLIIINICLSFESQVTQLSHIAPLRSSGGLALEFWGDREAAGSPSGSPRKKSRSEVGAAVGNSSKLSRHCDMSQNLMGKSDKSVDFQKDSGGNCGKLICFRSFDKNKMHEFGNNDGIHHWHVQNRPSNSRTKCVLSSSTSLEI